ncbi:unnamed protein product [Musa acuminata subsp. malaccensis]|uniref:(wild Malaysian banana) hypothetical protein n=1 Tax=Musa acuminata subsp. malaccensis TaxID=214687 RepID=A0A804KF36_MUSAM|nr:unnamed protein product [Musa acuminata subsp. malaccensis]
MDYRARSRLINQDKNKYNISKYYFIVRFNIVVQIISSIIIAGDLVLASAYAHELPRYGHGSKPYQLCSSLLHWTSFGSSCFEESNT